MSRWWIASVLAGAAAFVVVTGLLDDLVRVAIWGALTAAALLVWYGPALRLWNHSSTRSRTRHERWRPDD